MARTLTKNSFFVLMLVSALAIQGCGGGGKNKKKPSEKQKQAMEKERAKRGRGGKGPQGTPVKPPPGTPPAAGTPIPEPEQTQNSDSGGSTVSAPVSGPSNNSYPLGTAQTELRQQRLQNQILSRRGPVRDTVGFDVEERERALREREERLRQREQNYQMRIEQGRQERQQLAMGAREIIGNADAPIGTLAEQEYRAGAKYEKDTFLGVEAICGLDAKVLKESVHVGIGYVKGVGKGVIECDRIGKPFGENPIPPIPVIVELQGGGVGAKLEVDFKFDKGFPLINIKKDEMVHVYARGAGRACRNDDLAMGTQYLGEYLTSDINAEAPTPLLGYLFNYGKPEERGPLGMINGLGFFSGFMTKQRNPVEGCPPVVMAVGMEVITWEGVNGIELGAAADFTKVKICLDPDAFFTGRGPGAKPKFPNFESRCQDIESNDDLKDFLNKENEDSEGPDTEDPEPEFRRDPKQYGPQPKNK